MLKDPSQTPLPPPADPATDPIRISSEALPEIDEARRQSVRLVVSIPALILLITFGAGTILYLVLEFSDSPIFSDETVEYVRAEADNNATMARTLFEAESAQNNRERLALIVLLTSIGLSLVAGFIGYVLARQIVYPINQLTMTMRNIAHGDFSTRLDPIHLGELGQLGFSFNRMVEQLNTLFAERDRQLRESFKGAHLVVTRDGTVVQADVSVRRILGLSSDEIDGRNLLHSGADFPMMRRNPRLLQAIEEMIDTALEGRTSHRSISIRSDPPEQVRRYFLSATRLEGSNPHANVLLEIRDISGIAGFYEQIQRADRLAAVGTLATGIAHEIRNPLASIRGMIQLLAEEAGNDSSDSYHGRIIREVDRLEKLVAEIMNFAQNDAAASEPVDINELLSELAETARLRVPTEGESIQIEWDLDRELPSCHLQVERLRQALLNLLVNAFQHCALHNTGPVKVQTMHLTVNPQRPVIIGICNPGEPIDESLRDRLFEPFFTTKPEGTGLGLPIAYHSIMSNGGSLELEYEDGEIQFWVRLPREVPTRGSSSRIIPRLDTPLATRDTGRAGGYRLPTPPVRAGSDD